MAEAEGELEDAGPENALEGDRLSSGDASEDEVKDEVEPCRKRCGRDHALVLEECRLAVALLLRTRGGARGAVSRSACVTHGYWSLSLSLPCCSAGESM